MTKTFSQFMTESETKKIEMPDMVPDKDGFYNAQAVFGTHSGVKPERPRKPSEYAVMSTVFGKHSQPKKIKEGFDYHKTPEDVALHPSANFKPYDPVGIHDEPSDLRRHLRHVGHMSENLEAHHNKYSMDHTMAIHHYTEDSSGMNGHLVSAHKYGHSIDHVEHPHVEDMTNATHAHKTPEEMHVFTGTKHSPEHYPVNPETGKRHMHFAAFTSTSINPKMGAAFSKVDHALPATAEHQGRHMLKVHVPKDHPGAYIEHHTQMAGEHEFVLPRHTRMHVDATPETHIHKNYAGEETKVHVWHAKVLPHEDHE